MFSLFPNRSNIIKENNDIGTFELGNIKVTVNKLDEQQHKYIKL
jgi:hypothetical protein